MKCISDELIQKFIDKEASAREITFIMSHLATCNKCNKKAEDQRHASTRVKELVNSLNKNEIKVPIFQEAKSLRKTFQLPFKKIVYFASAACLLILFLLLNQKSKDKVEFVYSYSIENEYNANLPLSEPSKS